MTVGAGGRHAVGPEALKGSEMAEKGYRAAVERLASAQKPGEGEPAYLRWVNRPLGRRAAAAASVIGVTPNVVTLLSGLCTLAALVLIAAVPPSLATALGATALLLAGYALDSADGQLARLTGSGSIAGEWLDHVVDAARLPLFHLAIAVYFYRWADTVWPATPWVHTGWLVAAALGYLLLSSVWFFAQTLAEKLADKQTSTHANHAGPSGQAGHSGHAGRPAGSAPVWLSFAKAPYDVGTLYLAVLALPLPGLFAALYLALFAFTLAVAALSLRRKYTLLSRRASAPVASTEERA